MPPLSTAAFEIHLFQMWSLSTAAFEIHLFQMSSLSTMAFELSKLVSEYRQNTARI